MRFMISGMRSGQKHFCSRYYLKKSRYWEILSSNRDMHQYDARSPMSLDGLALSKHAASDHPTNCAHHDRDTPFWIGFGWASGLANPSLYTTLYLSSFRDSRLDLHPPCGHPVEDFELPRFDPRRLCRFPCMAYYTLWSIALI